MDPALSTQIGKHRQHTGITYTSRDRRLAVRDDPVPSEGGPSDAIFLGVVQTRCNGVRYFQKCTAGPSPGAKIMPHILRPIRRFGTEFNAYKPFFDRSRVICRSFPVIE
jgi:hypothetical protein